MTAAKIHYLAASHGSTVACGRLADVSWLRSKGVAHTADLAKVTCQTCRERVGA